MTMEPSRQAKGPKAYVIAEVEIIDPVLFKKYADGVPGTLVPFQGEYLVRGGKLHPVEGEVPKRLVVIAFDSVEKAHDWEYCEAYKAIKGFRHDSAKTRVFIAEGVPPRLND